MCGSVWSVSNHHITTLVLDCLLRWFSQQHIYILAPMLERLSKYVWNIEEFWLEAKDFLEQSGYRIPPRFDLDYVPSSRYEELSAETKMPVKQLLSSLSILQSESI